MTRKVQVLLLTHKAEVKEVQLTTAADGTITLQMIQTLMKKKEAPELIGTYKYKTQFLFLFGYSTGKAGTENKHELPPPHDTLLSFGDIILLSSKDSKSWATPIPFKMADYEAFYTRAFGGFEEIDSGEEEEEEEVEVEEEEAAEVEEEADEEVEEAAEVEEEEAPRVPKKKRRVVAPPPQVARHRCIPRTFTYLLRRNYSLRPLNPATSIIRIARKSFTHSRNSLMGCSTSLKYADWSWPFIMERFERPLSDTLGNPGPTTPFLKCI
jgi:hypothetical protein